MRGYTKYTNDEIKEIKELIEFYFSSRNDINYNPTTTNKNYNVLSEDIKGYTGIVIPESYLRDLYHYPVKSPKSIRYIDAIQKYLRNFKYSNESQAKSLQKVPDSDIKSSKKPKYLFSKYTFSEIDQFFLEHDNLILDKFRNISTLRKPTVADLNKKEYESYRDFIISITENDDYRSQNFLSLLNKRENFFSKLEKLPEARLKIYVERDLSKIHFKWDGKELIVEHPQLLWDCHCGLPVIPELGIEKRSSNQCKIHSQPNGAELKEIFSNDLVQITYAGVTVYWKNERDLWPPSIDTLKLVDGLAKAGIVNSSAKSVIDIGAGTGYLGLWVAQNGGNLTRVTFTDWLFRPLLYSALSTTQSPSYINDEVKFSFQIGSDFRWIFPQRHRDQFDIIICNPPYLPILPGFEYLAAKSTVAGTTLLEKIITKGLRHGRRVFVSFSSIVQPEVDKVEKETNIKVAGIGNWHKIPFRVHYALKEPKYLRALIEDPERDFWIEKNSLHAFYHKVRLHEVIET